jgi:GPH family glycoside/pentoside/hexuronide:cation symporter
LSDNTASRFGRRKPFILAGTVIGAIMLPFIWMPPHGSHTIQFVYVVVMVAIFSAFYSVFAVPYGALGYELTGDYDERTRVFAWKNYIGMIGVFSASWFYWFCRRPIFGNEIVGVRWLSVFSGLLMLLCTIAVLRGCTEKVQKPRDARARIPVIQALKFTFNNKPFLLVQAATLVVVLGTGVDGPIGAYLHVHYTCQGNKDYASLIGGVGGTLATLSIFIATPLGAWLSAHVGKRYSAMAGMTIMLLSVLILPWVLTPAHRWWVVSAWILSTIGMQCATLMFSSMMADICDEDELLTGQRREGSYAAGGSFLNKTNQVIVLIAGGWLPRLAGYWDSTRAPTLHQLERMKLLLITTQVIGVVASLVCIWCYPLTRARSERTRRELDRRRSVSSPADGITGQDMPARHQA